MSAGIPVEVCKVKAKEASWAQIEKVKAKSAVTKRKALRIKEEKENGWERGKTERMDSTDIGEEEKDDDVEDIEDKEVTGRWERTGKRIKI